jgi:hypothetical protein
MIKAALYFIIFISILCVLSWILNGINSLKNDFVKLVTNLRPRIKKANIWIIGILISLNIVKTVISWRWGKSISLLITLTALQLILIFQNPILDFLFGPEEQHISIRENPGYYSLYSWRWWAANCFVFGIGLLLMLFLKKPVVNLISPSQQKTNSLKKFLDAITEGKLLPKNLYVMSAERADDMTNDIGFLGMVDFDDNLDDLPRPVPENWGHARFASKPRANYWSN